MCNPALIAAATFAAGAAKDIVGAIGQNQAADANRTAANFGFAAQENTLGQRGVQIDEQQSENTVNAAIARAQSLGAVSASASSFGGDASTTAREANAAAFSVGQGIGREDINSTSQRLQVATDTTSAAIARNSQIAKVQKMSPLALGVQLGGDAVAAASSYSKAGGRF